MSVRDHTMTQWCNYEHPIQKYAASDVYRGSRKYPNPVFAARNLTDPRGTSHCAE